MSCYMLLIMSCYILLIMSCYDVVDYVMLYVVDYVMLYVFVYEQHDMFKRSWTIYLVTMQNIGGQPHIYHIYPAS